MWPYKCISYPLYFICKGREQKVSEVCTESQKPEKEKEKQNTIRADELMN